jgi:hypothetical protein
LTFGYSFEFVGSEGVAQPCPQTLPFGNFHQSLEYVTLPSSLQSEFGWSWWHAGCSW